MKWNRAIQFTSVIRFTPAPSGYFRLLDIRCRSELLRIKNRLRYAREGTRTPTDFSTRS